MQVRGDVVLPHHPVQGANRWEGHRPSKKVMKFFFILRCVRGDASFAVDIAVVTFSMVVGAFTTRYSVVADVACADVYRVTGNPYKVLA